MTEEALPIGREIVYERHLRHEVLDRGGWREAYRIERTKAWDFTASEE